MKKNKNTKIITALILTIIGVLFGIDNLQDFDKNYKNKNFINIAEEILGIFQNEYEVKGKSIYYEIDKKSSTIF